MSVESNTDNGCPSSSEGTSSTKKHSSACNDHRSSGTSESRACAACKYQRRRCAPDCPLSPYFPAENQQQFLNAHKLFGLRNLRKVLKEIKPPQRDVAIKTMIIQANLRASDPVGGCLRLENELREQINLCKAELSNVLQQLAMYRQQALQISETNREQVIQISDDDTNNVGVGQENGNGSSNIDEALNFYNSMDIPPEYDYNGHHHHDDDNAFDNIPDDRQEDSKLPVDGSSSEKLVLPKVEEAETGKTHHHAQPQTHDLKTAASHFLSKSKTDSC